MLGTLEGVTPEEYGNGHEYWDGTFALLPFNPPYLLHLNTSLSWLSEQEEEEEEVHGLMLDYTLGHFLRGVVQFTARHPPPESSPEARRASEGEASDEEIDAGAEKDFLLVLEHAPKVEVRFHSLLFSPSCLSELLICDMRTLLTVSWTIISFIIVISNSENYMLRGVIT